MQTSTPALPKSAVSSGPIVATIFGIPAVAIVVAAVNGASLPVIGAGVWAVVALWILVSLMCARGIVAMRERFGIGRASLIGAPLGIVGSLLLISGVMNWPLLLQPIANVMGSDVSLQRAAIAGVGTIMLIKWTIAWTSYWPRSN
jgi:hypothetical protein